MARQLSKVLTVAAVVAFLVLVGHQPAQAKDYPNGYDPESGWSWDRDFRYNAATNPFGYREAERAAWSYPYGSGGYYYTTPGMPLIAAPAPDNLARVRVVVPAGAKVWFDDHATKQTGAVRRYESPALTPGHDYSYAIKAAWTENGQDVTRTQKVDVRANSRVTVDFTRPGSGS